MHSKNNLLIYYFIASVLFIFGSLPDFASSLFVSKVMILIQLILLISSLVYLFKNNFKYFFILAGSFSIFSVFFYLFSIADSPIWFYNAYDLLFKFSFLPALIILILTLFMRINYTVIKTSYYSEIKHKLLELEKKKNLFYILGFYILFVVISAIIYGLILLDPLVSIPALFLPGFFCIVIVHKLSLREKLKSLNKLRFTFKMLWVYLFLFIHTWVILPSSNYLQGLLVNYITDNAIIYFLSYLSVIIGFLFVPLIFVLVNLEYVDNY